MHVLGQEQIDGSLEYGFQEPVRLLREMLMTAIPTRIQSRYDPFIDLSFRNARQICMRYALFWHVVYVPPSPATSWHSLQPAMVVE